MATVTDVKHPSGRKKERSRRKDCIENGRKIVGISEENLEALIVQKEAEEAVEAAARLKMQPEPDGDWDFDFTQEITADTTIRWKQ